MAPTDNAKRLADTPPTEAFYIPDLSHSVRMFPGLADRLGLLGDPGVITDMIQAHIVVEQNCENLLMMGGELRDKMPTHRRLVLMPSERAKTVADMNLEIAQRVAGARDMLNRYPD